MSSTMSTSIAVEPTAWAVWTSHRRARTNTNTQLKRKAEVENWERVLFISFLHADLS
jgi:hypothetical protein